MARDRLSFYISTPSSILLPGHESFHIEILVHSQISHILLQAKFPFTNELSKNHNENVQLA